jgi:hypothetical protein
MKENIAHHAGTGRKPWWRKISIFFFFFVSLMTWSAENAVKVLMSGIVFSTGYSLLSLHRKGTLTWDAVIDICGSSIFAPSC